MNMELENPYGVIYLVRNLINGKAYIGETTDFNSRVEKYKTLQCKGQRKLYNALKKYGVNNFSYDIIDKATCKEDLDCLEDFHIERFRSRENEYGYNIKSGGSHGKHSQETKKKISEARIGIRFSEDHKKSLSKAQKKRFLENPTSEEIKKKISKAMEGKQQTKGYKHTDESKKKMSIAQKKRIRTEEENIKNSESQKGRIFSEESKQKMSESAKRRYERDKELKNKQ